VRASRERIVEVGDDERRRLERNLHDGAQQRLLALCYQLRLARAEAEADRNAELATLLAEGGAEAQAALDELRQLAQGIYPAVLTAAGLDAALAGLADTAALPVEVTGATAQRYPAAVERAAYVSVAELIEDAAGRGASFVRIEVGAEGDRLVVSAHDDGRPRAGALVYAADRVGALGGSLDVEATEARAEIPCA
jgi:signal transduction histidine kinase